MADLRWLWGRSGRPPWNAQMSITRLLRKRNRHQLLIVCYHGVVRDADATGDWLLLSESRFAEQLAFLASEFELLSMDDGLRRLAGGTLDRPTACVTFDDGYKNNRTVAFPVLQRLGIKSTIYLATGLIGTSRWLWTTELSKRLQAAVGHTVDLELLGLGRSVDIATRERAGSLAREIVEGLKMTPWATRTGILDRMAALLPLKSTPGPDHVFLGWDDVEALARTGLVSFGAHTVNHEIVSRLPDDQLQEEIGGSIRTLRERLEPVEFRSLSATFAYPNGRPKDFDQRAERILVEHGITHAVTTASGLNTRDIHPMRLRRLVVGASTPMNRFVLSASGIDGPLAAVIGRARS